MSMPELPAPYYWDVDRVSNEITVSLSYDDSIYPSGKGTSVARRIVKLDFPQLDDEAGIVRHVETAAHDLWDTRRGFERIDGWIKKNWPRP